MAPHARRRRLSAGLIAAALGTVLVAGGCSASSDSESGAAPMEADRGAAAPGAGSDPNFNKAGGGGAGDLAGAPAEKPAAPGGAPGAAPGSLPTKVEPADRQIIRTATIGVRVEDVKKAAEDAAGIASAAKGLVAGENRSLDSDRSTAELTIRVPGEAFETTLTALGELGREESRLIKTDDVTEASLDLDARITSQQASVTRVRALMARATTIGEVVAVESELTRREAELAALVQRKRGLADQVSYSTITLSLRGPTAVAPGPPAEEETGFLAGLKDGWNAFVSTLGGILMVVGAILPFLLILVPLAVLFWWLRRRSVAAANARYGERAGTVPTAYGLPPAEPTSTP